MLKTMILMFFIFTLLMTPAIILYSSNDGLFGLSNYSKAKYSLGNLGFSGDSCRSTYVAIDKEQTFSCREGRISEVKNFGLIPNDSKNNKDYCGNSKELEEVNNCN